MEEVLDYPVDDLELVEDEQESPVAEDGGEGEVEEPSQEQVSAEKIDGRKFNPEWSKALKEIREANPQYADMLTKMRDNYARYQQLIELAPKGLEDVRGWKTTMEALGGPEAAASLMERAAEIEAIDERVAAADFSVVSELPEAMQKGFYQMIPEALNSLAENSPQEFAAIVKPHYQQALRDSGLIEHLEKVYGTLGDNEQAKDLVRAAYSYLKGQVDGAGQIPQSGSKSVDPQVRALQEKLAKYETTADDSFVRSVTDSSEKHLGDTFGRLSSVYVKQLGLTKEQQDDLAASFNEKITAKLGADAIFQSQLKAFKAQRNRSPEAVTNFIRSKIDEHAKTVLDGIVKTRYGAMVKKTQPRTAAAAKPTSDGALQVAQIPDQSEWDMDRMAAEGYERTAKVGIYHLKGGKTVKLARSA